MARCTMTRAAVSNRQSAHSPLDNVTTQYNPIRLLKGAPPGQVSKHTSLCSRKFQNVKLRLCWNLMISPPLWFYVKSNFGEFKRSKNVIFANFRHSELWFLVNLSLISCSNLLKSKFRTSKIVKINIFGPFEFTKIDFT